MRRNNIRNRLLSVIPSTPESFSAKINQTIYMIKSEPGKMHKAEKHNYYWRVKIIFAAATAMFIISLGFAFTIRPALAADIPFVSDVVYNLAPVNTLDMVKKERIKKTADRILNGFFSNALDINGQLSNFSDNWNLDDNTLLAAYYMKYLGATSEILNGGKKPSAANIDITGVEASAKAYRISADVNFDLMLDGQKSKTESIHFELEDRINGTVVTSMSMNGEDFKLYRSRIMEYRNTYNDKPLCNEISNYNTFLIGQAIVDYNKKTGSEEKQQFTKEEQIENIATELMYQYWLTQKMCIIPDIGALIERNDDTELFYLSMELQTKMASTGYLPKKVIVEKGYGEIKDIFQKNGLFTVNIYVKTKVDGSIGEDLTLLMKSKDDSFIIIGFDLKGEGVYFSLKNAAKKFIREGLSREEAYKKAYQNRIIEVDSVVKLINENIKEGLSQDEARKKALNDWYNKNNN